MAEMANAYNGALWGCWGLAFCGWVLLMAGAASMQQACGGSDAPSLTTAGAAGYLAPVSCDRFFRYLWWIWALFLFVLVVAALALARASMAKMRGVIIGLVAVLVTLTMNTANTFLYIGDGGWSAISGLFRARARVTVAGAIISSIALFLMLILAGMHDESHGASKRPKAPKPPKGKVTRAAGDTGAGTTGGGTLPVSIGAVGAHPGRISEPGAVPTVTTAV